MKTRPDPTTKAYYKCFSCAQFRKTCGGLPTREMDLRNWCEYIRDVMDFARLTNVSVAKAADVSLKTMERVSAINVEQDIMRATARRIELAVIGPVGDHRCCDAQDGGALAERVEQLLAEVAYWRKENDRKAKIIDKYLD